jgi:hypothetical protein
VRSVVCNMTHIVFFLMVLIVLKSLSSPLQLSSYLFLVLDTWVVIWKLDYVLLVK